MTLDTHHKNMLKIVVVFFLIFARNAKDIKQFASLFQVSKPPSTLGIVFVLGHMSHTNTDPLRQLCVSRSLVIYTFIYYYMYYILFNFCISITYEVMMVNTFRTESEPATYLEVADRAEIWRALTIQDAVSSMYM